MIGNETARQGGRYRPSPPFFLDIRSGSDYGILHIRTWQCLMATAARKDKYTLRKATSTKDGRTGARKVHPKRPPRPHGVRYRALTARQIACRG
jgi:hypothetical protein